MPSVITQLKRIVFTALFVLCAGSAFSQSKNVWLFQADYYYEKNDFASALRLYQMVLDDTLGLSTMVIPYESTLTNQKLKKNKDSDSTGVAQSTSDSLKYMVPVSDYCHHQIAMCYRQAKDYKRALEHFQISAERGKIPDDYYYVANSIMGMGDYEQAIAAYDNFIMQDGTSDVLLERALQDMTGCVFAMKLEADDDIFVNVEDTVVFNQGTASFAVSYWGGEDKLVFSSARSTSVIIDPEKQDPNYLLDLYYTERDGPEGDWHPAKNFGRPLNSARHEASGWFNNGNAIYFTRWSDEDRKYKDLYVARHINMRFFESQKLDSTINNDSCSTINPFVTKDGKWLYFSSDMEGGQGGYDIWRVKVDPETGLPVEDPQNLGKPVNSEMDEKAPFYHEKSRTLFFSSDGHETIGGLDIFKSDFDKDAGNFMIPVNMGIPINSTADDSYFIIDEMLRFGFLSSNRSDCVQCDSTFSELCASCYKIFNVTLPELEFAIQGYVFDKATGEIIPNATIEFKDISYKWEHFEIQADENGFYKHHLVPNLELFLRAGHKGYFADKAVVFTLGMTESRVITQDFYLEKIPDGEIEIKGIEYDFDSANLREESKKELDKVVEFLELNNNLKIEIRSHTDERGSDSYNETLSQKRAESVVNYLVEHGIPLSRLVPKGYGEKMPAEVPDENGNVVTLTPEYIYSLPDKEKQEEYHQRNRRTAFFVLEEN